MSKVWFFSIAILLCSALAVETLTCHNCKQFKIQFDCIDTIRPSPCTAAPGQKCKIVKSFLDGTIRGIIEQGCTKSIDECDLKVFHKVLGPIITTCCDDRDFCNIEYNTT